jgi:hypothetical protein
MVRRNLPDIWNIRRVAGELWIVPENVHRRPGEVNEMAGRIKRRTQEIEHWILTSGEKWVNESLAGVWLFSYFNKGAGHCPGYYRKKENGRRIERIGKPV